MSNAQQEARPLYRSSTIEHLPAVIDKAGALHVERWRVEFVTWGRPVRIDGGVFLCWREAYEHVTVNT